MKRLAIALVVVVGALTPTATAYADHDGYGGYDDGGGYSAERDCRDGGGCNNRRREEYGDNSCKYVCPAFDKSPVQDSFNLTICVMPGSCTGEEKKGDQPAPQK